MSLSVARSGTVTVSEGMLKQDLAAAKNEVQAVRQELYQSRQQIEALTRDLETAKLPPTPTSGCNHHHPQSTTQPHHTISSASRMPRDPAIDAAMRRMQNYRPATKADIASSEEDDTDESDGEKKTQKKRKTAPAAKKGKPAQSGVASKSTKAAKSAKLTFDCFESVVDCSKTQPKPKKQQRPDPFSYV